MIASWILDHQPCGLRPWVKEYRPAMLRPHSLYHFPQGNLKCVFYVERLSEGLRYAIEQRKTLGLLVEFCSAHGRLSIQAGIFSSSAGGALEQPRVFEGDGGLVCKS